MARPPRKIPPFLPPLPDEDDDSEIEEARQAMIQRFLKPGGTRFLNPAMANFILQMIEAENAANEKLAESAARVRALLDELNVPGDQKKGVTEAIIKSFLGNLGDLDYDIDRLEKTPTRVRELLDELAGLIEREPSLSSAVHAHPLFNRLASTPSRVAPLHAPEEWGKRPRASRETCIDFAERVYADWIDRGMTLSDLRDIDRPLYNALAKWLERSKDERLPKRREQFLTGGKAARTQRILQELRELGIKKPTDAYRALPDDPKRANRLYQAALRLKPPRRQ